MVENWLTGGRAFGGARAFRACGLALSERCGWRSGREFLRNLFRLALTDVVHAEFSAISAGTPSCQLVVSDVSLAVTETGTMAATKHQSALVTTSHSRDSGNSRSMGFEQAHAWPHCRKQFRSTARRVSAPN